MSQILTAFNNHFTEFVDDVKRVFPEDVEKILIFLKQRLR